MIERTRVHPSGDVLKGGVVQASRLAIPRLPVARTVPECAFDVSLHIKSGIPAGAELWIWLVRTTDD
jgi:hypothetical protein